MTHRASEDDPAPDAPSVAVPRPGVMRRIAWSALARPPLSLGVTCACQHMIQRLERTKGPAVVESRLGIVRLWRCARFDAVALRAEAWRLDDGTCLQRDEPVFEMHIASDRLLAQLQAGHVWRDVIGREFASMVPDLRARPERAIVGSTILVRQVEAFGATTRRAPTTAYHRLDAFYRKLILLAFHPGGLRRVMSHRYGLVDAAISTQDFCARYGA